MEVHTGIAHGKIIELDSELGFPEGQSLSVMVQPLVSAVTAGDQSPLKEDLRMAFGAWAEEAEDLDEFLEWNRHQRKIGRPEIEL